MATVARLVPLRPPPPSDLGTLRVLSFTGKGTTFYSWLDVPHTASTSEISKAYRKKSLQLQCVLVLSPSPKPLRAGRGTHG